MRKHDDLPQRFYDESQAAFYLGVSVRTLQKWRLTGGGPRFRRMGRAIRYALEDLDAFAGPPLDSTSQGVGS